MAHYDIFRVELALQFYDLGHALWEPSPGQLHGHAPQESSPGESRHPVSIGDVGFICRGQFHRIFNALLPKDHPINMAFGTPADHEPLQLMTESHISTTQLDPNNFYSREVTMVSGGLNVSLLREGGSAQVSFECSKEQGAMLCLPVRARGQDTLLRKRFRKCIIDHIDSWFAFSQSLELEIERMEDIILVTGCHLTRSFVNVAFSKSQNNVQAAFGVHAGGSTAEIAWRFSREPIHGAMVKYGPDGNNLLENQCIFVRGFRASRRLRFLPVKIEGAAEPTADSDPPPDKHLISVPSSSSDPLHVLLQYLAEKEPSCDMVLVHDDDLGCISGASLRSLQPGALMDHLRDSQPQTYCYQSFDYEGSSKAGARVRVAMSKREYKSSPPEDITLSTSGASRTSRSSPPKGVKLSTSGASRIPRSSPPESITLPTSGASRTSQSSPPKGVTLSTSGASRVPRPNPPESITLSTSGASRTPQSSPPEDITLSTSGALRTPQSSPTHSTHGIGSLITRTALLLSAAATQFASSSSTPPSEEAPSSTAMEPERSKTSQRVAPPLPSSLGSSGIPSNRGRDFRTDGYISYTFSPRVAEVYLSCLLGVDPQTVQAFSFDDCPGAFFVWNHAAGYSRPSRIVNKRPVWLLDYVVSRMEHRATRPVVAFGSVVPQQLWSPQGQSDWRRYVEQAQLRLPIFFVNTDGSVGVPVTAATTRQMSLLGADEPVPLDNRTTLKIRIYWPGYVPSEQQVQLRDQTPARNPVSFARFVRHVGSRVQHFLVECERIPLRQLDQNSRWIVGHGRIPCDEVVLIGVVQVSARSWTLILQLKSYIIV